MERIDFKKNKYDADLIIGSYSLKRTVKDGEILHRLLNCTGNVAERYQEDLEIYRERLEQEGDFWNEEELKMHFLSHIFFLANINEPNKIKLFYERILKDDVEGHDIYVKCDCMVATPFGINTPKAPYFFLQEFKKAKKPDDPEGQMLLAMISAQHRNNNGKPIYGSWLQGKYWVFTTLHEKNYCVSKTFDATNPKDLYQIIFILQNLKYIILQDL
jgi:hypothetical protein